MMGAVQLLLMLGGWPFQLFRSCIVHKSSPHSITNDPHDTTVTGIATIDGGSHLGIISEAEDEVPLQLLLDTSGEAEAMFKL